MSRILYVFFIATIWQSCVEIPNKFSKLPPGVWRAVIEIDNKPFAGEEEVMFREQGDIIPFLMNVVYDSPDSFHIEILNGDEVIVVDDIIYGRDLATAKDTIIINFPVFDTYIKAICEENIMEGKWYVNYRESYSIPFKAYHGQDHLFTTNQKNVTHNLSGKWSALFEVGTEDEYPAIAEFFQKDYELKGTFLTETGDYRFLDGQVINNKFYLSTFDGAHAFLFKGKILEDGSLIGSFRSGKHYSSTWNATRDENAKLSNPFNLSKAVANQPISFSLKNPNGDKITLDDQAYSNKPKLIQIFGTWCPNCLDETKFLLNYLKDNPDQPIEIIAVAFERYDHEDKSLEVLRRYKEKLKIPYEVLYGGYYDKSVAKDVFPVLNKVISYPTLLFVDEDNLVQAVHTGFSGPATSEFDSFKSTFRKEIEKLLD